MSRKDDKKATRDKTKEQILLLNSQKSEKIIARKAIHAHKAKE